MSKESDIQMLKDRLRNKEDMLAQYEREYKEHKNGDAGPKIATTKQEIESIKNKIKMRESMKESFLESFLDKVEFR